MRVFGVFAAACALFGATANAGTIVFEDGFEDPDVTTWGLFETAGPWTALEDYVEIQDQSLGIASASEGEQYAELAGNSNSTITAMVDFVAGQQYTLSFDYRARTDVDGDNAIAVYVGTLTEGSFEGDILTTISETMTSLSDWMTVTLHFTAAEGVNAILFSGLGGPENGRGGFIDDVRVIVNPIPGAAWLFGTALFGGAFASRSRKKARAA